MSAEAPSHLAASALFENAPPAVLQRKLGLTGLQGTHIGRHALLIVAVAWVPLAILVMAQSMAYRADQWTSFLWQFELHARYLIAMPLLVLADAYCAPQLSAVVLHFQTGGFIREHERHRFEAAVTSTRRLLEGGMAEVVIIAVAYATVVVVAFANATGPWPVWHRNLGVLGGHSVAGWWHLAVSTPLLLMLLFGWLWRLALWARVLWLIAHLDLRLVASHPDHVAGLSFVGHSLRAFSIVALAIATIVAGRSAHIVLNGGTLPTPHLVFNLGFLAFILLLLTAPLLVFSPRLFETWRRGTLAYGDLANRFGHAFENKWIGTRQPPEPELFESPDFSTAADLSAVVSNVYAIRTVPVGLVDLISLAVAMMLPFVPVLLLTVPIDVIWADIVGLLF